MKPNHISRKPDSLRGTLLVILVVLLPLFSLSRTISVQAANAALNCPTGKKCVYLPSVHAAKPPVGDLVLTGFEVTQVVQDPQNSVPLVAGKSTMLRIYARTGDSKQALSNIRIAITATRSGANLSSSPSIMTATLPLANSRGDINSTLNMKLPANWLSGTIDLTVRLDPDNQVAETNENNNAITQRLTFTQVPPLNVKIIPIRYTHNPNGRTYAAPTQDIISSWIFKTYPIHQIVISWHAPYNFTGDLMKTDDWLRLLNEITALKKSEGAPNGQIYYGLVPPSDSSSTWFHGGVAGIGWVGSRTSVGMNSASTAGQIAAHEIGHNMGMMHTPCGSPSGLDASYPYSDGSIGQFGIDVSTGQLFSSSTKDVMSYCNPKWISDYTYKALYRSQVQYGAAMAFTQTAVEYPSMPVQRSLLVRAQGGTDGDLSLELLPVYVISGNQMSDYEAGEYQLHVLGADDEILVQIPVRSYGMEDADGFGIHARIPLPDKPAEKVRLVKDGQVVAEKLLQVNTLDPVQQMIVEDAGDGNVIVRWSSPEVPALIRYSLDEGKTWTTLAVDVEGGQLLVKETDLPAPGGIFEVIQANMWQ
jgi:hypothetical protein